MQDSTGSVTDTGAASAWDRVLIAEDSPMIGRMMRRLLRVHCEVVDVVGDGQAAVDAALDADIRNQPYVFVLMDLQMPVMDGLVAIRNLRQAGYGRCIIAISAGNGDTSRQQAMEAGADDFLAKPIDRLEMYEKMRRLAGPAT